MEFIALAVIPIHLFTTFLRNLASNDKAFRNIFDFTLLVVTIVLARYFAYQYNPSGFSDKNTIVLPRLLEVTIQPKRYR